MSETPSIPALGCPKRMVFGPCADVGTDGSCEVPEVAGGPARCVFLESAPRWGAAGPLSRQGAGRVEKRRQLIMSELPEGPNSSADIRRIARRLVGSVDAVLFGDSNWQRVRYPPSYRSAILRDEGLGAWPGINCRDRNRVALEGELLALADIGVVGVHCVTGNHPHSGHRPDAAPVFDLDSTRLAALASGLGLQVSIAASPHTPPTHLRTMRTADKAAAGATVCMLDQPVDAGAVAVFIDATRALGATVMTFVPVVSVVMAMSDFDRWSQYPNARIPMGWGESLADSNDVKATGRALAYTLACELLQVDGVSGVLFGSTADPELGDEVAETFADLATELKQSLRC